MEAKLSALEVKALRKQPGKHRVGPTGLYLQVKPGAASASWLFRFMKNGKAHWAGLGRYSTFDLPEARHRARAYHQLLADGGDPLLAKREKLTATKIAAARSLTFDECARAYIADQEAGWSSSKHKAQWSNSLAAYASPVFGSLPVAAVDDGLVLRALKAIWTTKPETASRVRGRIEAVLDSARVNGLRSGENPARWKGHLSHLLPPRAKVRRVEHFAAMPYTEVGAFTTALREREGIAARALEFAILTAARTNEVLGARWDEIDGDVWVIPGTRMKGNRPHRVPLSDRAREILEALPREDGNPHVFVGARAGKPLAGMAMLLVLRGMGRGDVTTHGFRSSFRDWAAERTAFANHVLEMALAHAIPSGVEAAYRRSDLFDQRRQLMQVWAEYCAQPSGADNVLHIGKRRNAAT
jgi:integrase